MAPKEKAKLGGYLPRSAEPKDEKEQQKESKAPKSEDEKLLKEIRDNFEHYTDSWRGIREEARTDMRYINGDPWDPVEKKSRKENERPCIAPDELNQYINQTINDLRQNKRAVKLTPKGSGANDKTAEWRQNLIRNVEYESNAQTAYVTAGQDALERSYGYFRINIRFVAPRGFDKELVIRRIPNPDTVYLDPDCKEFDCSDGMGAFVFDLMPKAKFQRDFPNARIRDFGRDLEINFPLWIKDTHVVVAEYWKVKINQRKLFLLAGKDGKELTTIFQDEIPATHEFRDGHILVPGNAPLKIVDDRKVDDRKVIQYITNGVEILDKLEWAGQWIPIIPVFGKERYIDDGSGSKRVLHSLTRLARDAYMAYCYLCSSEIEEAGMAPKAPFVGYTGQFQTDKKAWQKANKKPHPYLQADPIVDQATNQVLPLPTRPQFTPNFDGFLAAKGWYKQAIQAAVGKFQVSVGQADTRAESGKAINLLDQQSDRGSFHFIDNYELALAHGGRIMDDLIDHVYRKGQTVGIRDGKEKHSTITLGDAYVDEKSGKEHHYPIGDHDHSSTISAGPAFDSQREVVNSFVDTLIGSLGKLPVPPPQMAKILALAIKMKDMGPLADEIAQILSPEEEGQLSPQAQAAIQNAQAQLQQAHAVIQQLQQEKLAKREENFWKFKMNQDNNQTKKEVAEIMAKAQTANARAATDADVITSLHESAHELALESQQQAHEKEMQQMAGEQAQQQAAQAAQNQAENSGAGA